MSDTLECKKSDHRTPPVLVFSFIYFGPGQLLESRHVRWTRIFRYTDSQIGTRNKKSLHWIDVYDVWGTWLGRGTFTLWGVLQSFWLNPVGRTSVRSISTPTSLTWLHRTGCLPTHLPVVLIPSQMDHGWKWGRRRRGGSGETLKASFYHFRYRQRSEYPNKGFQTIKEYKRKSRTVIG